MNFASTTVQRGEFAALTHYTGPASNMAGMRAEVTFTTAVLERNNSGLFKGIFVFDDSAAIAQAVAVKGVTVSAGFRLGNL